jgi:hypothetical protein
VLKPAERVWLAPGDVFALLSDGIYEYENGRACSSATTAWRGCCWHNPARRWRGCWRPAARSARLRRGAPQLDDVTAVLIAGCRRRKRAGGRACTARSFARSFDALAPLFSFLGEAMAAKGIAADAADAAGSPAQRGRVHRRGAVHEHGQVQRGGGGEIESKLERRGGRAGCRIATRTASAST